MLYLFDANVLITADRLYYPMDRVPHFWGWILENAKAGNIKLPCEIYDEITDGKKDDLVKWLIKHKKSLQLDEQVDITILQDVIEKGYAPDLDEVEVEKIAKDPFLIAYARAKPDRCVVTLERSSPRKKRANKKIPDICSVFSVPYCDTFELLRKLDFKIT